MPEKSESNHNHSKANKMPRLSIRLTNELHEALAERKPEGESLAGFVRALCESATGVYSNTPKNGLETLTSEQRSEIGKKASKARWSK